MKSIIGCGNRRCGIRGSAELPPQNTEKEATSSNRSYVSDGPGRKEVI